MARRQAKPRVKPLPDPQADCGGETYQPITSIWNGTDGELLEKLLEFYPRRPPKLILDATVNAGRFWAGNRGAVVGLDINDQFRPDVVADNRRMPFKNGAFDAVIYDPPHVPNQGGDRSKDFNTRFGLVLKSSADNGYNLTHLYPPFAREAFRVLIPEGVLFCKIADYVHNHRYQWAHVAFLEAAVDSGFCACDCIIKVRSGPIVDPRWRTAHHARRRHCYWLVFRKSHKCE
jgi:SAM-dependent methyltransferase